MLRRRSAPLLLVLALVSSAQGAPDDVFASDVEPTVQNGIDAAVFARLKYLGLRPAKLCTDQVFVRRVHLDVLGTLPTPAEVWRFLRDRSPTKRATLVDQLLARPGFADYWALKWGDLLRVKAEFPINLWPNAAKAYHRWIRTSLAKNVPFDRFARQLLTASGSNFRVPQVNFYRAIQRRDAATRARAVALTFMGARAERWEAARLAGMAVFFSQVGYKPTREWKEEIVQFDAIKAAKQAAQGVEVVGVLPDGKRVRLLPHQDPRRVFADWLTHSKNPWFARAISNRVWSWLLGRGVIDPVDDLRPTNRPWNPALLTALERQLVASRYDLKALYRFILRSHTYQQAAIPRSETLAAEAEFACYPIRRLEAEVLIDALCRVTGSAEKYSSLIPEPYTIVPAGHRAVTLPDGSITSSFLELFGRPARDTGLESERNNRASASQRLHLLNSTHVRLKIERSPHLRAALRVARSDPGQAVRMTYLRILSRFPSPSELKVALEYAQAPETKGRDGLIDLTWALINSSEFSYRH